VSPSGAPCPPLPGGGGGRLSRLPFVGPLVAAFGWRPVAGVGLIFFVIRGILNSALGAVQLPFFRDVLGVTESSEYQRCTSVIILAWAAKPGIGLLADSFPLWGYYKRSYMALCSAATTVCSVLLGMLAVAGADSSKRRHGSDAAIAAVTVLFFMSSLGTAMVDLLTESIYAVLMRRRRDTGSAIVTWCWSTATAGSIIAVVVAGPLADDGRVGTILALMAGLSLVTLLPSALNWFDERPLSRLAVGAVGGGGGDAADASELIPITAGSKAALEGGGTTPAGAADGGAAAGFRTAGYTGVEVAPAGGGGSDDAVPVPAPRCVRAGWERFVGWLGRTLSGQARNQPKVGAFALAMTFCTAVAALAGMFVSAGPRLGILVVLVAGLVPLSFECLPRLAARGNIFMFCSSMLYVQIPGALDYFFTADEACVPGGPHFDYTYYTTVTGVIGAVASGLGVALFERFLSRRRYTSVFYFTTAAKIVASVFDLMLVTRWNRRVLGLSDKAVYLWGDAVVFTAASMLDFMPMVVLTSRLCPHGVEALMYAILAGFSNFGQNFSRTLGELFIRTAGIRTTPPCDFSALPTVIVIAHGVLPLLTLPCAYFLLPRRAMDERLLDDDGGVGSGDGGDDLAAAEEGGDVETCPTASISSTDGPATDVAAPHPPPTRADRPGGAGAVHHRSTSRVALE
jgi:folate/biopterin transporter